MYFFFADDSRQKNPTRPGMGPLVAIGGIVVPAQSVAKLEKTIDSVCIDYGFPTREEFKWSPGREFWMRSNLVHPRRQEFFLEILSSVKESTGVAFVVIADERFRPATSAPSAEIDVVQLFLERADRFLSQRGADGIVITDRPSGDRRDEDKFLLNCLEALQTGTQYVQFKRIALNVLSAPSKFVRLLQAADVVTSCTAAMVAGETSFSPTIFAEIKKIFVADSGRVGGVGLKIHPDAKYANLYHWLLEDTHFWKGNSGIPLPSLEHPIAWITLYHNEIFSSPSPSLKPCRVLSKC